MPEWGDEAAVYLCESMKIDSHKQKDKLTEAKKLCYNKGFYQGKMIIGTEPFISPLSLALPLARFLCWEDSARGQALGA